MKNYRFVFTVKDNGSDELYRYEVIIPATSKQYGIRIAQTRLEMDCPNFEEYDLNFIEEVEV